MSGGCASSRAALLNIVSNMLEPVGGVSHVRIVYPLQALRTDPDDLTHFSVKRRAHRRGRRHAAHLHAASAVAGRRTGAAGSAGLLSEGWVIVTEFDDHPDHFGMLNCRRSVRIPRRACGADQHAGACLGVAQAQPRGCGVPQHDSLAAGRAELLDPNVVTLFFGALNREHDWAPLMPALNAVAEKAGERLRFCVVHDQQFFDALHTPHKQFTPTCDHDTYMALLGQCEISFMPLADTPFNRAKSDLKFIEAGACRVAALASHIVYADSIDDGRTGLLFRDADRAARPAAAAGGDAAFGGGLGNAARNYVAGERMLAYQVAPRIAWYRSLWTRREELTQRACTAAWPTCRNKAAWNHCIARRRWARCRRLIGACGEETDMTYRHTVGRCGADTLS